ELQNNIFVNGTLSGRGANWGGGSSPTTAPPTTAPPTTTPPATNGRDAFSTIEAESRDSQSGTTIVSSPAASGGAEIGSFGNADEARFDRISFSRTPGQVTFRYSSPRPTNQAFTLEFHAGAADGPVIAAPGLLGTGSLTSYKQISFNVSNLPA